MIRLDADIAARAGEPGGDVRRGSASPSGRCSSALSWWPRATTCAGVQLAAVLDADVGLAMPDFRAEERTFALLTQLVGAAGTAG